MPLGSADPPHADGNLKRLLGGHSRSSSPRRHKIYAELLKLGIDIGETSVGKYMVRHKSLVPVDSLLCRRSGCKSCMFSSCWRTSAAVSSNSVSRPTPPRSRSPSNCGKASPGHYATLSAAEPRSDPRQGRLDRAYVERVIGTIRRECLDHVIVFNEASLDRRVKSFLAYYQESRTHLSRAKDAAEPRPVQLPEVGHIMSIPQAGGLHHRYERRAA